MRRNEVKWGKEGERGGKQEEQALERNKFWERMGKWTDSKRVREKKREEISSKNLSEGLCHFVTPMSLKNFISKKLRNKKQQCPSLAPDYTHRMTHSIRKHHVSAHGWERGEKENQKRIKKKEKKKCKKTERLVGFWMSAKSLFNKLSCSLVYASSDSTCAI